MVVIDAKGTEKWVALFRNEDGQAIPESEWLSVGAITDQLEQLREPFGTAIPVTVIDRVTDIGIESDPDDGVTSGVTFKGKIHLVREGLVDSAAVARTFWHELLHFGLRRFMTRAQYIEHLGRLYASDGWVRHKADQWIAGQEGKGMHWRTFERLKAEHDAFANASWMGMAERLGLMNRRMVGLGLDLDLGREG